MIIRMVPFSLKIYKPMNLQSRHMSSLMAESAFLVHVFFWIMSQTMALLSPGQSNIVLSSFSSLFCLQWCSMSVDMFAKCSGIFQSERSCYEDKDLVLFKIIAESFHLYTSRNASCSSQIWQEKV